MCGFTGHNQKAHLGLSDEGVDPAGEAIIARFAINANGVHMRFE